MKTKLLKNIRKQYSVVYFDKGSEVYGLGKYTCGIFHVYRKGLESYGEFTKTKESCIDWIMKDVRSRFGNKKKNNNGIKVWYNG